MDESLQQTGNNTDMLQPGGASDNPAVQPNSGTGGVGAPSGSATPPADAGNAGAGTAPPASAPQSEDENASAMGDGAGGAGSPGIGRFASNMYHGILSALGGANDVSVSRGADGSLQISKAASGPGSQWKRIISGALTGAGAAAANARPGPGGLTRAAGAGVQAGAQAQQDTQDNQVKQANQDFDTQQKAMVQKAQQALITQQTTANAFELSRRKVDAAYTDAKDSKDFMDMVRDNGGTDLGTAANLDDLVKMHGNDPNLVKKNAQGLIASMPQVENGKVVGVHFAEIPQNWDNQRTTQDVKIPVLQPGKDGKLEKSYQVAPAGTLTNAKAVAYLTNQGKEMTAADLADSEEKYRQQTGRASAAKDYADANEANVNAKLAPKKEQFQEDQLEGKATTKAVAQHNKDYVVPAENTENSFRMADRAYSDYETAKKQGKELPTGAQSMLMLSQHLATTFGNVKGSRVTKDMIQEHLGARSITDSGQVAIQRLTNGDQLSPGQWTAFHDLVSQARTQKWETAVKEAKRADVPIDFLPPDLSGLAAPKNASSEVFAADGKTLIGHVVDGKYQKIGN